MNVLDHSGSSGGFPLKLFIFSFLKLLFPENLLVFCKFTLGDKFLPSTLDERLRELRNPKKILLLLSPRFAPKRALDISVKRKLSFLLTQSKISWLFFEICPAHWLTANDHQRPSPAIFFTLRSSLYLMLGFEWLHFCFPALDFVGSFFKP